MYHKKWWNNNRLAEDLDLVISMYNLLEYSSNYSDTTRSLWCFPKDEATKFNADIGDNVAFKTFVHKTKLVEEKEAHLHQIITMEF